jgi:hypothetical protein
MAKSEGPSWKGTSIYMSFNKNKVLDDNNSQDWSIPTLILSKPGHVIWYPSLQPIGDTNATRLKYTSLQMGEQARLFYKDQTDTAVYISEYAIRFKK